MTDADRIAELEAENARLKEELASTVGAVHRLAAGVIPHWRDHFVVYGPPDEKGKGPSEHAVPWEWAQPPFQVVKQTIDEMDGYGARAVSALNELSIVKPDAERWRWLTTQREIRATRSWFDRRWTFSHLVWSPRSMDLKPAMTEGATLEEAVDNARGKGESTS